MTALYATAALMLATLIWLVNGLRRIGAISNGTPIGARGGTALLLIDLQEVFWTDGPYTEAAKSTAQDAILAQINTARANGYPVIAVRQEWSIPSTKLIARLAMKGQAIAGTAGTQLAQVFTDRADHTLVKRVQDAFETGTLDHLLAGLNVGTLILVGLDFNHCVQKTALAARNRGYHVTVIKRGTLAAAPTQASETRMKAQQVVLK